MYANAMRNTKYIWNTSLVRLTIVHNESLLVIATQYNVIRGMHALFFYIRNVCLYVTVLRTRHDQSSISGREAVAG